MNIASDGAFRISIGRSFQSVEDEYLKCLSPNLVLVSVRDGTAKTMVLADRTSIPIVTAKGTAQPRGGSNFSRGAEPPPLAPLAPPVATGLPRPLEVQGAGQIDGVLGYAYGYACGYAMADGYAHNVTHSKYADP